MLVLDPNIFAQVDAQTAGETLAHMQRSRMSFLIEHRHVRLSQDQCVAISEVIREETSIIIPPAAIESIFDLYPHERIEIAINGLPDTESQEAVSFVVANYFGSTRWPINKDKTDINIFVKRLQDYAVAMGYKLDLANMATTHNSF